MFSRNPQTAIKILLLSALIGGCQETAIVKIKESTSVLFPHGPSLRGVTSGAEIDKAENISKSLDALLKESLTTRNEGTSFVAVLKSALENDPVIIAKRKDAEGKLAAVGSFEAQKEFQISSTLYGGVEDLTENEKGLALALNASRLIFDGGMLDAEIASKGFSAEAARFEVNAAIDERVLRLGESWLEVEKFETLKKNIDGRLAVLDPLIDQLEKVARAGVGDVSKVTAAQRTVSSIRVTQTDISERLATAQLHFKNAFGSLASSVSYDARFISDLIPNRIDNDLIEKSPILRSYYAKYQAGVAKISALEAKADFNVGFEARVMRPFAGSGKDSDETVGFVASKTIYNGGMLKAEIEEAKAAVESGAAQIKSTYREGVKRVKAAQQNIESMDKAILLARKNVELTTTEISYLKQQLVIGGSSLDSVLSAEARLYEAESKEISFITEKRKSQLLIASTLGLLHQSLDF